MLGNFKPPIDYGIQSPAIGRGGPNMPANSRAEAASPYLPIWLGTMLPQYTYPYGTASSKATVPVAPNMWTAYMLPTSNAMKSPTSSLVF